LDLFLGGQEKNKKKINIKDAVDRNTAEFPCESFCPRQYWRKLEPARYLYDPRLQIN